MTRREFLGAAAALRAADAIERRPPNVVYVLADDLGWGDLRCYNPHSAIPTPHADRLAREGIRFTDMHSPSAVCTPTRYGILTGRYAWRTRLERGVLWGYSPNLIEPGRMTVASLLRAQGYRAAVIGKWHLGLGEQEKTDYSRPLRPGPLDLGFDYFFGIPASLDMEPYLWVENDRAVELPTRRTEGRNQPRGVFWRPGAIAPGFRLEEVLPTLTERAVRYIRAQSPERPFFLYVALTSPHTPWLPGPRFRGKSGAGDYGDFVVETDDALGRILQALDEAGLAQETLVIFTSDNGAHWTPEDKARYAHRANAAWRGMKADIWEAGHRVPFLARWPGRIRPGATSDYLGCLTDLMATLAEILGVELPPEAAEDSFSMLGALVARREVKPRPAVVLHSGEGMFAIREGPWKLIRGLGSGGFSEPRQVEPKPGEAAGQLYHLGRDPGETVNLYEKHPETVARLEALLEEVRRKGRSQPR
jgi:arylsulfatase A-like enzyme